MNANWKPLVENEISVLEASSPDANKAASLAALYVLRDHFGAASVLDTERLTAWPPPEAEEESKMDMLLRELKEQFDEYMLAKASFMTAQTETNLAYMLKELNDVLDTQRSLFSALWQGSTAREERDALKAFFTWYATKYKL